jgi:Domain of unknown function (DUF1906)
MVGREASDLGKPFRADILIEMRVDVIDDPIEPSPVPCLCLLLRHVSRPHRLSETIFHKRVRQILRFSGRALTLKIVSFPVKRPTPASRELGKDSLNHPGCKTVRLDRELSGYTEHNGLISRGNAMTAFAGFDSSAYPGDVLMKWLRVNTNLVWCGYYFGKTPSHTGTSWIGKRDVLQSLNWGIAPLYVGQQTVGKGSHHPDTAHGVADGQDAAQFMRSEGFALSSVVYLDLENGLPFPQKQKDYVKSWCGAVQGANFTPGVYCSHTLASRVAALVPEALIWAFKVPTTKAHKVPGPHYPDPSPAGSGYPAAFAWQLDQHCLIEAPGAPAGQLEVDLNSASTPNPSIPRTNFALDPARDNVWAGSLLSSNTATPGGGGRALGVRPSSRREKSADRGA